MLHHQRSRRPAVLRRRRTARTAPCSIPFFEGDVIEAALSLDVATDVVSIFGNYGLTDRWDVGVAVPFVHVDMDATVLATDPPARHRGQPADPHVRGRTGRAGSNRSTSSGSASGIGDIELRTKYRLLRFRGRRRPGGSRRHPAPDRQRRRPARRQLAGEGLRGRVGGTNRITQHVNVGYTFPSGSRDHADRSGRRHAELPRRAQLRSRRRVRRRAARHRHRRHRRPQPAQRRAVSTWSPRRSSSSHRATQRRRSSRCSSRSSNRERATSISSTEPPG